MQKQEDNVDFEEIEQQLKDFYSDDEDNHNQQLEFEGPDQATFRTKNFDVTYNEDQEKMQEMEDEKEIEVEFEEEEDEEENPMTRKLKEMKQQLRNQIQNSARKEEQLPLQKQKTEDNEDNQGYESYTSPEAKSSQPNKFEEKEVQQFPNHAQYEQEKKSGVMIQPPVQTQGPISNAIGAASFDRIKNSKLFQKFMQKESGANPQPLPANQKVQPPQQPIANVQREQKSRSPVNKKPQQEVGQTKKSGNQLGVQDAYGNSKFDDFQESKLKSSVQQQSFKKPPILFSEQNLEFSADGIVASNHLDDDSQIFQNQIQNIEKMYYQHARPIQENKNYLLDQSELNNEGELIGYSEQILGKINDMAPGIPNQDEVLCHQPPEQFVNMMHEQFNNEMPWLIENAHHKQSHSKKPSVGTYGQKGREPQIYNNAAKQHDQYSMDPVRQDMQGMRTEMQRMQEDYQFVNDRFTNLKEKYDKLQEEYNKDKTFYEEALEARMNQMEQLENENEQLQKKYDDAHRKELDLKAQLEAMSFDKEMMEKSMNNQSNNRELQNKKDEEMFKELRQLEEKMREKEFEFERSQGDFNRMKAQLDRTNQECDRLRSQLEYAEQEIQQKESEKQMALSQVNEMKSRLQQEQTDQHFLRGENEELKNEIMMLKQQANMASSLQEQLRQQLFDMRGKMSEIEHREFLTHSTKDLMQREIQQLKMQLSQANSFIQQQAMFYTQTAAQGSAMQKPPQFSVQTTNWDTYEAPPMDRSMRQNQRNYDQMPPPMMDSREAAVPKIPPKQQKQKQINWQNENQAYDEPESKQVTGMTNKNQMRSNNIGSILQWDDQPSQVVPPQKNNVRQQHRSPLAQETNVTFPSKQQPLQNESNIVFPSRQPEQNTNYPPPRNQRKQNQRNDDFPFEHPQANNDRQGQQKNMMHGSILNKPEHEKKQKQLQNIEANLLQLNLEKDKYKAEYDKIPDNAKTIAQRRRKEDLERELDILNKNIYSLKTKLKDLEQS